MSEPPPPLWARAILLLATLAVAAFLIVLILKGQGEW